MLTSCDVFEEYLKFHEKSCDSLGALGICMQLWVLLDPHQSASIFQIYDKT